MKRVLLIVSVFLINISISAAYKFLLETEKPVSGISLINSKIGKTTIISPLSNLKNYFVFSVDNIDNSLIRFSENIKIKLYSFSDRIGTEWRPVEENKPVALKSFLTGRVLKEIDLETFMISTYSENPINSSGSPLRGDQFFVTADNVTFASHEKMYISWNTDEPVVELKIDDLATFTEIYSTQSFNDTVLTFKNLPEHVTEKLKNNAPYCLCIKTKNHDFGYTENKLIFNFDLISFIDPGYDLIFLHEQKIDIRWQSPETALILKIYNDENKQVYQAITSLKSYVFNAADKVNFQPGKRYKIELRDGKKCVTRNFYLVFNYNDYKEIIDK